MKQVLILTLICTFNTFSKAQNMPFKIGFLINPTYSDRLNTQADLFSGIFVGKYAYAIGIFAQKRMTHTLDLRFGANFVNNGEQTKQQTTFASSSGLVTSTETFQLISNFYNAEIPIDIQWFMNRKRSFFAIVGASPSFNLSKSATFNFYSNDKLTTTNTVKVAGEDGIGLAVQFGIGYQKSFNDNLLLEIQPKFRYYVTKMDSNRYMYNAGLQINLIF
jgi:Outer membrane protein beta-barrel domain